VEELGQTFRSVPSGLGGKADDGLKKPAGVWVKPFCDGFELRKIKCQRKGET